MQKAKHWKLLTVFFVLCGLCWQSQTLTALTEDEQNTIMVVKKSVDSVVFITNIQLVRDFFFREDAVARGSGSGFIWDNQGHIVTNYHVIEDGDIFAITLPNQKQLKARLVGKEPNKDIAVLKIEDNIKDLCVLKAGTSKTLQVGQKVIAIGNPFGFDHTVTSGIVSALGRQMMGAGGVTIRDMIQTDASINPGNSGGPLLNSDGELIGMSTMIYSSTGTSAGIGFAVPVDTIKKIVPQIIKYGKVIRPGLGISLLQDSYARRIGLEGVGIVDVPTRSEAYKLGIRGIARNRYGELYLQDVIVGIDEHKITCYDDLYNTLENYRIGETVTLVLKKEKRERKVRFTLVGTD
jgi:S1-C subfamily serine protease